MTETRALWEMKVKLMRWVYDESRPRRDSTMYGKIGTAKVYTKLSALFISMSWCNTQCSRTGEKSHGHGGHDEDRR